MAYQPTSIKKVVEEINNKYFLPHIQRELVWKPRQIYKLFDSLMRGYPINTFLFWRLTKNKEITKLKFIDNYEKGKKNELHTNTDRDEYWLVLDGQQRLQSFYLALKGTYDGKELFLNVLSEIPAEVDAEDDEIEIVFETKFFKKSKIGSFLEPDTDQDSQPTKKLWLRIKDFALLDDNRRDDFIDSLKDKFKDGLSLAEGRLLERNTKKLHKLCSDDTIFFYLEDEEDYDKVLDIFIRTNSGGTKLSKSDLLFSMVKLHWKEINAYERFNALEKDLNNQDDFEFDKDFILKTSLVLIGADPRYRIENFNKQNISAIESKWEKIEESIRVTVDLLSEIGLDSRKTLTSKNSIIPIVYYTYTNQIKTYASTEPFIVKAKQEIKWWLFTVLLVKLYSSQTDEMLKRAVSVLNSHTDRFPSKKLLENLPLGKSKELKHEAFDDIAFGDGEAFLVLALLYPDFNLNPTSRSNAINIDHLFPRSLASKKGFDAKTLNNIGNLAFLTDTENKGKSDMSFKEWVKSQDSSFLKHNLIPDNTRLYTEDMYKEFIVFRRQKMFEHIVNLIK